MDDDLAVLRRLLDTQPVAALATLHRGEPAVSMVPFVLAALGPDESGPVAVIHVSALAPHTADLRAHPRAALLVTADADASVPAQARPRVSLQVDARPLDGPHTEAHRQAARDAYLARFPDAGPTFALADFTLVALRPVSARLVAGFGRAHGLSGERLAAWLHPVGGSG